MTKLIIEVENQEFLKEIQEFLKKKNIKVQIIEENITSDNDEVLGIWADKYPPELSSEEIQKQWRSEKWKRF